VEKTPTTIPPIATRFPVNRKDHTQKHPNGYLTPLLKRFLNKKIDYIDPETNQKISGKVKDAVMWRLLLNGCQGETPAIKEILDRLDGKVLQRTEHSGQVDSGTKIVIIHTSEGKVKNERGESVSEALSGEVLR